MKEICNFDFRNKFEAWLIKNADNSAYSIKRHINAIDKICQNTSFRTIKTFKQKYSRNKTVSQVQNSCQSEDVVRNSSRCDWHDIAINIPFIIPECNKVQKSALKKYNEFLFETELPKNIQNERSQNFNCMVSKITSQL